MDEPRLLALNSRADEIFSTAKAENRDFTPQESREIDEISDEFRRMQELDNVSLGRRTEHDSVLAGTPAPTRYGSTEAMPRSVTGAKKTAGDIFGAAHGGRSGFRNLGEFVRCVGSGLHHTGLQSVSADWQEGVGESGGFFVAPEYAFNLWNAILERSIVLSGAEIYPMASNNLIVPHFDYSNHSSIGGFAFEWLAELQTATNQDGNLKSLALHAKKIAVYTSASLELISDAGPVFTNKLETAMADAAAFGIDYTLLNTGNGVGQPLSVLNSASLITAAAEGGQAADTVVFNNILAMYKRVLPASQIRGQWYCHPSVVPQLFKMAVTDNANAILAAALDGVFTQTGPGAFSLLGRPVTVTEKLPVLGDVGDLLFADLGQYVVGMRKQIGIERSLDVGWQNYSQKFRLIMRLDGCAKDDTAVTPLSGDTLSWAVALAAR